jgi:cell division protease FtsH
MGTGFWAMIFAAAIVLYPVQGSCQDISDVRLLLSYTDFRQQLENGNVLQITISGDEISGQFLTPLARGESPNQVIKYGRFITYLPSFGDGGLFPLLQQKKVVVNTRPKPNYSWTIGFTGLFVMAALFLASFWITRRKRMQGEGLLSMSRNRARLYERQEKRTLFADVAGAQSAKEELAQIVEFLKNPSGFQRLGGKMPKGVLLMGPPGTGKTLLARAVAGEANVPFFSISGSDFMEIYVGVGASRVRSMFVDAKKVAPSILFIDELDSIGRHRGVGNIGGGGDEREQTLNQLLSEMDGFEPNDSVIVMAATNRPDVLDPALLRPGRFDRHITVDLPSLEDRQEILKVHAKNKPLDTSVDLKRVARSTPTFSGADLENLLNEAAILAARRGKDAIGEEDVQEARDKVILGLERKNINLNEEERRLLAYHEAGHAVVAAVMPSADPLYKVTIIPRGRAMGVTQQLPEKEKYVYSKDYVLSRLAVMLGGRAAEMLIFRTSTSGAEADLKQAMELTRRMILDWGMSDGLAHLALGGRRQDFLEGLSPRPEYSEQTAWKIDEEEKKIIEESFHRATEILRKYREGLDRVAAALIEKEEIPGNQVTELIGLKAPST